MTAAVAPVCYCGAEPVVVRGGYLSCPHCDRPCPLKADVCGSCQRASKHQPSTT